MMVNIVTLEIFEREISPREDTIFYEETASKLKRLELKKHHFQSAKFKVVPSIWRTQMSL